MTYEELIKKLQDEAAATDVSEVDEHLAIQFNVEGDPEGRLYIEIKDGKIDVQPYEYYDRDAVVTTSADVLLDMVSGRLDIVKAFMTHKISVSGDLGKAAKFAKVKKLAAKAAAKKTAG